MVTVVGGGIAGSEAAWQVACRGIPVTLIEMRPKAMTPAHQTADLGELVCSNSFGSLSLETASGVLKAEIERLGSLILRCAKEHAVPAGSSLAVDRDAYAADVTAAVEAHPLIERITAEVTEIPEGPTLIATGPLTGMALAADLERRFGSLLAYFDAASPILTLESVNLEDAFWQSRYDKGEASFLNCPLTKEEYEQFWEALTTAERHPLRDFEENYFEACLPVEVMAERGCDTLRFGPMKPVGLTDPRTGRRPYAVVQLRQDNGARTLYNIVGFQTNLRWPEQRRVFGLIPALRQAEFVRYGVMHRNTFLRAPGILNPTLMTRQRPDLAFAGQMTGTEGYLEAASTGLIAGINLARLCEGQEPIAPPADTMLGALLHYLVNTDADHFQPMNVNFGLLPELASPLRDKRLRKQALAERALVAMDGFAESAGVSPARVQHA